MIFNFPKWWSLLTYDGFKYKVNVTDVLGIFAEDRIKVGKEEADTSAFNKAYDKFQAKQDKAQTRHLLELTRQKVHVRINQCNSIMIISTAIQNIPAKVWTDSFVAVNLHPHHHLSFSGWIKKIAPDVKMGETAYFWNHEGSYYYSMPSVCKKMTVIKRREVMYVID